MSEFKTTSQLKAYIPIILCILPIFHFFISVVLHQRIGYFYLTSTDPEYFYLMSGGALSNLNLDIGFIDHPGSPINIVVAIASKITFLLSGENNIYQDIVKNPELYIFTSNLLFNVVLSIIIYYLGSVTIKHTNNLKLALILQAGFFSNMAIIPITARLLPEGFMLLPLGVLIIILLNYLYDKNCETHWKKYIILFSIIIGWGTATKLSFAPFIIIPLFLVPGLKRKLAIMAFSIIFFFIIAFPVLHHLNRYWHWVSNLFIHSGIYGTGESNVFDVQAAFNNVFVLFKKFKVVFGLMAAILILNIYLFFNKKFPSYNKYRNVSLACVTGGIFFVLFVSKHFKFHYFFPELLFQGFFIFLLLYPFILKFNRNKFIISIEWLGFVFALFLMGSSLHSLSSSGYTNRKDNQLSRIVQFKSEIDTNDLLIISGYYAGTPFKEFSLSQGYHLSGPVKKYYKQPLFNKYKNSFIYYEWSNKFFNWNKFVDAQYILQQSKPIYVYISKGKESNLDTIINRFSNENPDYRFKKTIVESNEEFGDRMYMINILKTKSN